MTQPATEKSANVELALHEFTERLGKHPFGWRAVVLNLSHLRPNNRRAQQIRIAANTFESLVRHFEGQIFLLAQGDIVFICKDADVGSVDSAVNKVRHLFGDDPLAVAIDDIRSDGFSKWYDLARDYMKFAGFVQNLYIEEQRRQKRLAAIAGDAQRDARQPMDPAALAELVKILERAGKTRVIIARCDNADAIRFGHESGIHLFQRRHIDRLLSAGTSRRVARKARAGEPGRGLRCRVSRFCLPETSGRLKDGA